MPPASSTCDEIHLRRRDIAKICSIAFGKRLCELVLPRPSRAGCVCKIRPAEARPQARTAQSHCSERLRIVRRTMQCKVCCGLRRKLASGTADHVGHELHVSLRLTYLKIAASCLSEPVAVLQRDSILQ